jgi:hypothetical protein
MCGGVTEVGNTPWESVGVGMLQVLVETEKYVIFVVVLPLIGVL